jgi:hypothetical protein
MENLWFLNFSFFIFHFQEGHAPLVALDSNIAIRGLATEWLALAPTEVRETGRACPLTYANE